MSIPLTHDLGATLQPGAQYEGTEPWRPPETLHSSMCEDDSDAYGMCDRTDIFAFGLVIWEMLAGDVPHAALLPRGDDVYRAAIGTRPPLPPLPSGYDLPREVFERCTQPNPALRPSARQATDWLDPTASPHLRPPQLSMVC